MSTASGERGRDNVSCPKNEFIKVPRQRGVAVITALLIVSLAALVVSSMLWRQQLQLRALENRISLTQARSLAYAAVDWSRLVLWEDQTLPGRAAYDHPNEPWGVALAETRISDGEGGDTREAFVSGRIEDQSGRLNLLDLLNEKLINPAAVEQFERLASLLKLDTKVVTQLTDAAKLFVEQAPAQDGGQPIAAQRLPAIRFDDWVAVAGLSAEEANALRPYVAVLPKQSNLSLTPINANTASAQVLYARIGAQISWPQAQALANYRDKIELRNLGDIETALRVPGLAQSLPGVDVKSEYFRVEGRVRYERALVAVEALVWRAAQQTQAKPYVLWIREPQ